MGKGCADVPVDPSRLVQALKEADVCRAQWAALHWEDTKADAAHDAELITTANRPEQTEGRAQLTAQTREWVMLEDADKLDSIKGEAGLLRQYQSYINTLSKQLAAAESSFLGLYKVLAELPDPSVALAGIAAEAGAVPRLQEHAAEVRQRADGLEAVVSSHEKELSELLNQEVTIQQLRDEVKALNGEVAAARAEVDEVQGTGGEREQVIRDLKAREEAMLRQLGAAGEDQERQRHVYDETQDEVRWGFFFSLPLCQCTTHTHTPSAQMMALQSRVAELMSGHDAAELILQQESEASRLRLAEVMSDNNLLRTRLEVSAPKADLAAVEDRCREWEDRCTGMVQQIEALDKAVKAARSESDALGEQCSELKEVNHGLSGTVEALRTEANRAWEQAKEREDVAKSSVVVEVSQPVAATAATAAVPAAESATSSANQVAALKSELEARNATVRALQTRLEHRTDPEDPVPLYRRKPDVRHAGENGPNAGGNTPADRAIVSVARFMYNNRLPRLFFAAYFVFLHVLLFTLTLRLSRNAHSETILRYPHRYHGAARF